MSDKMMVIQIHRKLSKLNNGKMENLTTKPAKILDYTSIHIGTQVQKMLEKLDHQT